ncbi:MAG: response regulator [Verrucomicrobia bacterium]|nr:response regulator [Verrucomicrobiota bacterium]MBI3867324.1 response regulator [Verrucomicrobiota bacterium]
MNERAILLVEDSPDDRELMLQALRRSRPGQAVVAMADSAQALDLLLPQAGRDQARLPLRPALVILDLKMPKLNGLELLRKLREQPETALIPVVILTSSANAEDVAEAYTSGVNGYVVKPVQFDRFVQVMESICRYWLDCDALSGLCLLKR